jgi:S1-C subfamily serine protease
MLYKKFLLALFCVQMLLLPGTSRTAYAYEYVFVTAVGKDMATAEVNARVAAVRKTLQEKASMEFLQEHGTEVRRDFLLKSSAYTHGVTVTKSSVEANLVRIEATVEVNKEKIGAELQKISGSEPAAPARTESSPSAPPAQRSESDLERRRAVASRMESGTVWIIAAGKKGSGSTGSGFMVGNGYIMTNAHVVEAAKNGGLIVVVNDTMPPTQARLVALEHITSSPHGSDFALLQFTPPGGLTFPILTFNAEARRMDRVSAWGYPGVVIEMDQNYADFLKGGTTELAPPPVVFTEGVISAIVQDKSGSSLIHTASVSPGSSGGPLINENGQVIGINSWIRSDKGAVINAALYCPEIIDFLRRNKLEPLIAEGSEKIIAAELAARTKAKSSGVPSTGAAPPGKTPATPPTARKPANISGMYKVEVNFKELAETETFSLRFIQKGKVLTVQDDADASSSFKGAYDASKGIFSATTRKDSLDIELAGLCAAEGKAIRCSGLFIITTEGQTLKAEASYIRVGP